MRSAQPPRLCRELLAREHVPGRGHAARPEFVFPDAPRFLSGEWLSVSLEKEYIARPGARRELLARRGAADQKAGCEKPGPPGPPHDPAPPTRRPPAPSQPPPPPPP